MERDYIDRENVVQRYVEGTLSEDERRKFEDRFIHDPELAQEVSLTETLVEARKLVHTICSAAPKTTAQSTADSGPTTHGEAAAGRPSAWRLAAASVVGALFTIVVAQSVMGPAGGLPSDPAVAFVESLRGATEMVTVVQADRPVVLVVEGPPPSSQERVAFNLVLRAGPDRIVASANGHVAGDSGEVTWLLTPPPPGTYDLFLTPVGRDTPTNTYRLKVEAR